MRQIVFNLTLDESGSYLFELRIPQIRLAAPATTVTNIAKPKRNGSSVAVTTRPGDQEVRLGKIPIKK